MSKFPTYIESGFDFLSLNLRSFACKKDKPGHRGVTQDGYTLLIRPSRKSEARHILALKASFKEGYGKPLIQTIRKTNSIIRR